MAKNEKGDLLSGATGRSPHEAKRSRCLNVLLAGIFFTLLWMPSISSVFQWDTRIRVNENRFAAPFPDLNLLSQPESLKEFATRFEHYFNDHFGLRQRLISWSRTWKQNWFGQTIESHVIVGRQGWLFGTWSSNPLTEHEAVTTPFTPEELRCWQDLFESRRDWLKRRGISYLVVIPPDKQSAYPENLPDGTSPVGANEKLEQFMAYMKSHSDVEILNLLPALQDAKGNYSTYFKTDSHWNEYGAFVACNEIIATLSKQVSRLKPLPLESFDRKTIRGTTGNLAWMLTGRNDLSEPEYLTFTPRASLPKLLRRSPGAGGEGFVNPEANGKALIFGDSFTEGLLPFLAYHFHDVIYLRQYDQHARTSSKDAAVMRAHTWNRELIERERPAVVIDEILNSLLYIEDPAEIKKDDALDR